LLSGCSVLFAFTGGSARTLWSCLSDPVCLLSRTRSTSLTMGDRTDALPVHYVFPRRRLDLDEAVGSLLEASEEPLEGDGKGVMVVWDVAFDHLAGVSFLAHLEDSADCAWQRGDYGDFHLAMPHTDLIRNDPSTSFDACTESRERESACAEVYRTA